MHAEASDVVLGAFDLSGVDTGPELDAQVTDIPAQFVDRRDRSGGSVEEREDPVTGGRLPARALLTLGEAVQADELRLPDNVVAETHVPHAAVVPHASLVVTHAGHGTVMAATTAGLPMVCTPMGRDQFAVAGCVERLGLGLVASMEASADELRNVMATVLADEGMRRRSLEFAGGLDLEAGMQQAITRVETLASPTVS